MKAPLLLMPPKQTKGFGGTIQEIPTRSAWICVEWPHDGTVDGLIILSEAPGSAWMNDTQDQYETRLDFTASREGWRAGWRVARLLACSHRGRPAHISGEDLFYVAIALGPRTSLAWEELYL